MSDTKISVTEADIDDELMRGQNITPSKKSLSLTVPKISRYRFHKPSFRFSPALVLVLVLLVLAGGGLGYKKYTLLQKENVRLANPQAVAEDETNRLKNEVAQLIELPNEKPTIATVVDVEKLKSQPFFANAQNGDRVLLFAEAKKAILYRPGSRKLVEVMPINIGDSGVAGASTPQTTTKTTTPAPTTTTTKKP